MNKAPLRYRALYLLSPELAQKRYTDYVNRKQDKEAPAKEGPCMAATGFGNHGASRTLNSVVGWLAGGGSAEDDSDLHGNLLRRRSRDLYYGGGLVKSALQTLTTNVVGWGIQPKPKIDADLLGLSEEECEEWERNTMREFRLWAENSMCDAERSKDFYSMQQLAFLSMLMSGDVFVVFGMKENTRTPYQTTIRLLEADRVSTPDSSEDESEVKELDGGGRIVDGIEIDKEGVVVRYHIANRHPLAENYRERTEWAAIDAIGKETGYPNVLHVAVFERPEQRRGTPFIAADMENLKQLDRYMKSELAAQIVSSYFSLVIESTEDDGQFSLPDAVAEEDKVTDNDLDLELGPGVINQLPPGKKVHEVNPIRQNTAFEANVSTYQTHIGASVGIPKEVLVKKYDSNYTAARSAKLDFHNSVRVYRTRFNNTFNQPIYEMWLAEAVATGRIQAPGFFDDPIVRNAWCGCMWIGTSMGHVDPLKEVSAAAQRILLNITTEEQEASEYNGNDWQANVRQRKKELHAFDDEQTEAQDNGGNEGADDGAKKKDGNAGMTAKERFAFIRDILKYTMGDMKGDDDGA